MNLVFVRAYMKDGAEADPDSVILSDPAGLWGIRDLTAGTVTVAAGWSMVRDGVGAYHYTLVDAIARHTYECSVKAAVGGYANYFADTQTAGADSGVIALSECADWLRIESEAAWPALQIALTAAEAYVARWTGLALADCTAEQAPLWRVAAMSLAGIYNDNREGLAPVELRPVPFALQAIMDQLRGPVV
jgi:hypothetical protein